MLAARFLTEGGGPAIALGALHLLLGTVTRRVPQNPACSPGGSMPAMGGHVTV
jgi:hypothetical protein